MTGRRAAVAAGAVLVALALQLSVLPRIGLPGAVPDCVLVVVVGLALAWGPHAGAVTGFGAGLALDLAPPGGAPVGTWALVLTLAGAGAGRAWQDVDRSAWVAPVVVAGAAALATLGTAAVLAAVGDPRASWGASLRLLPTAVLYDAVLAPFVVPGLLALVRRVEPDPLRR